MSRDALGAQFTGFHGTAAPLKTGDSVLPPSRSGARQLNVPRGGRKPEYDPYTNAHATTKESVAWAFAGMSAGHAGGRASVKRVTAPKDTVRPGVENRHNPDWLPRYAGGRHPDNREYVGPQFKVEDSIDIMPPETVRKKTKHMRYGPNPDGRQGTLPLDWQPFTSVPSWGGGRREMSSSSANHPTGHDIKKEQERIAEQEAERQPPKVKGKGGMKQPMLPGMRGAVKRKGTR